MSHLQVRELVWFLVVRLGMRIEDLVLALMMVERCIAPRNRGGLLGINFVRRLWFACCSLTIKVNNDVRASQATPHVAHCAQSSSRVAPLPLSLRTHAVYRPLRTPHSLRRRTSLCSPSGDVCRTSSAICEPLGFQRSHQN